MTPGRNQTNPDFGGLFLPQVSDAGEIREWTVPG